MSARRTPRTSADQPGSGFVLGNRDEPWGFLRVDRSGEDRFEVRKVTVTEPTYGQSLAFTGVGFDGRQVVGLTTGAWFQEADEPVFTIHDAATLADAVTQLEAQYPGIQDRILDEAGQIRRFVNIYVNGEDVRFLDNINTRLNEADEVSIVPAVAGGCRPIQWR